MPKDASDPTYRPDGLEEYRLLRLLYEATTEIIHAKPYSMICFSSTSKPEDLSILADLFQEIIELELKMGFTTFRGADPSRYEGLASTMNFCFEILSNALFRRHLDPVPVINCRHAFARLISGLRRRSDYIPFRDQLESASEDMKISLDLLRLHLRSELEPDTQTAPKNNGPMSEGTWVGPHTLAKLANCLECNERTLKKHYTLHMQTRQAYYLRTDTLNKLDQAKVKSL
jgi:hypothetical protein